MVHLSNGQFLNELVKLFQQSKDKGTVLVTMKRSMYWAVCACIKTHM